MLAVRRLGEKALLIEVESNALVHALARYVRETLGEEAAEVIPGHDTLVVVGRRARPAEALLAGWAPDAQREIAAPRSHVLGVVYDGLDLHDVADECRISAEELVGRHQAGTYHVAFCGFSPGFAYLIGGDPSLRPGRLADPRPRIPAGSVALAGEYSAVYPSDSPGGWRLVGTTSTVLFDASAAQPSLLQPGETVTFRAV